MKEIERQTSIHNSPQSPFRGIQPFRFVDRQYYYGRAELIDELVDKVVLYRLVILFGESGAGKSSLLNAGLVPALKKKGYQPERLRVRPFAENPLLIERIEASAAPDFAVLPSIFASPEDEAARLTTLALSLEDLHRDIDAAVKTQHPVLIFDQFEELFTLFAHGSNSSTTAAERALQLQLLDTITGLANNTRLKVKIILTIREDFLGKLEVLTEKYPQVLDQRIRLGLLTAENAKESILNPFLEPNQFPSSLTKDLADVIVEQLLRTQPERTIPPTQLQIVCSRLWDEYAPRQGEIDVKEFNAMGQVKGILKEFLTSELQLLDEPLREPAVQVLGNLVTDSNTRDVVSQEKIRSLLGKDVPDDQLSVVLKSLEARRLINQVAQRGTYYFELSSEFLIEPVQKEVRQIEREQERERAQLEQARQRKKTLWAVTTASVLFVFLLLALGATFYALNEREKTRVALIRAEANEKQSRRLSSLALITLAHQDLASGNFARLVRSLNESLPDATNPKQDDLRSFSWYYLWHKAHREQATLSGHTSPINSVAFSPDSRLLASASDDKTVRLWDASARQELATLSGHTLPVRSVVFSPDGKMLATTGDDGTVKLWDVNTRQVLVTFSGHFGAARSVAFSPDGKMLASSGLDRTVRLWDVDTRAERTQLPANLGHVLSVVFSPDGKLLAAGGNGGVELWDFINERKIATLTGHVGYVLSVAFSPDSKTLASASADKDVKLWNLETRRELATLKGHISDVRAVVFSPDGRTLASASLDGALKLWNLGAKELRVTLAGHALGILSACFSPDGKILASGSRDKTAKLWDPAAPNEVDVLPEQSNRIFSVAFSPDNRKLAAAESEGDVKVWEVATRRELATLPLSGSGRPRAVAFSPDGRLLAVPASDGTVRLWETVTWRESDPLQGRHLGSVNSVAFSVDGRFVASGSDDSNVKLWEIGTRQDLATLQHEAGVLSVAFSPDGKTLASSSYDRTVRLWDINTRRELATLRAYSQGVICVAFSHDGKVLASGDFEGNVKLWDVATRQELATLIGHVQGVLSLSFSPDDQILASASYDKTLRLWDLETRQQIATLTESSGSIYSAAFSPDGKTLASAGSDKKVSLWIAATDEDVERQRK